MNKHPLDQEKLFIGPDGKAAARVAWIDAFPLTRDAVICSLKDLHPEVEFTPFNSVQDYVVEGSSGHSLILLYSHGSHQECLYATSVLRRAFVTARLIVLSDRETCHQVDMIRDVFNAGANGLIPARILGLAAISSAIRFVESGGLLSSSGVHPAASAGPMLPVLPAKENCELTPRQKDVLLQLQRGKSNKLIAHELGISESTAKVHIRNLMKKMHASNRTQVAFNAMALYPELMDSV